MIRSFSAEDTRRIGERLASLLEPGDVILLLGDLGAGKSELTRGIAKGLGVTDIVTSPTFTILNVYESGRIPLYHFDWYRLNGTEELYEMGLDEYLNGDGIAVIEWPMKCPEAIPENCLAVRMIPDGEDSREIHWRSMGGFRPIHLEET